MSKEYTRVKEILASHGALDRDLDGLADMGSQLYDDLFDYYMASSDMPYGTIKARDGDPDVWIGERLCHLGLAREAA
jgi:hypothetical protein